MVTGIYKSQPRGMGNISTNINRGCKAVDLDSFLIVGNRTQRRFAKKQLKELEKSRRKQNAC